MVAGTTGSFVLISLAFENGSLTLSRDLIGVFSSDAIFLGLSVSLEGFSETIDTIINDLIVPSSDLLIEDHPTSA